MTATRRAFLAGAVAGTMASAAAYSQEGRHAKKARAAITFDLEMSRMYPTRDMMEWDYQKGWFAGRRRRRSSARTSASRHWR